MSISVVNGYLCTSCNDVAKAKKGENPHPPPGSDGNDGKGGVSGANGASPFDRPAVTFGGSLSALLTNAVDPAAASQPSAEVSQRTVTNAVDLLV
jgi:hypothetical protein